MYVELQHVVVDTGTTIIAHCYYTTLHYHSSLDMLGYTDMLLGAVVVN